MEEAVPAEPQPPGTKPAASAIAVREAQAHGGGGTSVGHRTVLTFLLLQPHAFPTEAAPFHRQEDGGAPPQGSTVTLTLEAPVTWLSQPLWPTLP